MAFSAQQWDIVKAYFERGVVLSEIVKRPDVLIKSKGSIRKRATADSWEAGKKKRTVADEVLATQEI